MRSPGGNKFHLLVTSPLYHILSSENRAAQTKSKEENNMSSISATDGTKICH